MKELAVPATKSGKKTRLRSGLGTVFAAQRSRPPRCPSVMVGELLDHSSIQPPSRCLLEKAGALLFALLSSMRPMTCAL